MLRNRFASENMVSKYFSKLKLQHNYSKYWLNYANVKLKLLINYFLLVSFPYLILNAIFYGTDSKFF